jgi:hypothetical protein
MLGDLEWFVFLFEGLVLRDIRVFSQALDARMYHYRDESGPEADIVIEFPDGRWVAVGLVVATATGPAYTRPGGVRVVPAASLGPERQGLPP